MFIERRDLEDTEILGGPREGTAGTQIIHVNGLGTGTRPAARHPALQECSPNCTSENVNLLFVLEGQLFKVYG